MAVRYITVKSVTNLFKPATRSFGDVAIVGAVDSSAGGPDVPVPVTNPDSVSHPTDSQFAGNGKPVDDAGWFKGDLGKSIRKAFAQTPGPLLVWAVKTKSAGTGASEDQPVKDALSLVGKLDVQIVVLANTPLEPAASGSGGAAAQAVNLKQIEALAEHVNNLSERGGDGKERIGVAMLGKGTTDVSVISGNLKKSRMSIVAHKSDEDAAAAAAGAIAGYEPHISMILKPLSLSMSDTFTDTEIDAFNAGRVNWVTSPTLIPGGGMFLGEGYTTDVSTTNPMPYIDIVRTIDDISFRLKAQLIQSIGNLRISRAGLRSLSSQMAGVLEPLRLRGVIDTYEIVIPLLALLDQEPLDLLPVESQMISSARANRTVEALVAVKYAAAIHRLNITLKFE